MYEYDKVKKDVKFQEQRRERESLHRKLAPMRDELCRIKKVLNIKDSPETRPPSSQMVSGSSNGMAGCSSDSNDENHNFNDNRRKRLKADDDQRLDDNNNRDRRTNGHTLANNTMTGTPIPV